jgi:hypothetical protein
MWSQGADASTLGSSVREGSHSWTAASTFHLIENKRIRGGGDLPVVYLLAAQ